jgi:drug/metabolite transporter (DMT)-like permease
MFALGIVTIRKDMDDSNFLSSVTMVALVGNLIFWPILLVVTPSSPINIYGLLFLVLGGLLHPAAARLLYFNGILRIGIPSAAAIFSTYPLISALFAVFFLNESPSMLTWLGIIFVVVSTGVIQVFLRQQNRMRNWWDLFIPLGGSLTAGLGYVLKKMGLNAYNEPIVGAGLASLISLIFYTSVFALWQRGSGHRLVDVHKARFWGGGLFISVGYLFLFYAMRGISVGVVASLVQTEPMFVLALTHFCLKNQETTSKKVLLGTLITVAGVMLVTWSMS